MKDDPRPRPDEYAPMHAPYVALVPDGPIVATLRGQAADTVALLAPLTPDRASYRYAPGKWSVKEVLGHVIDAERIFAYRALCAARGDATPLPGFDENAYVAGANFGSRSLGDLIEEFRSVRDANVRLFAGLDAEALGRRGTANGAPVTARGLLHVIAGHELHHRRILRERYLETIR